MRQDKEAKNCFFLTPGEVVKIEFRSTGVPQTPIADSDRVYAAEGTGQLQKHQQPQDGVVTFSLTATKPRGKSHSVEYECVFFSKFDPLTCKYLIYVTSDLLSKLASKATPLLPSGELWFTVE